MRLKRAAGIVALLTTLVLGSAAKCEERGPDVVPGEGPEDKVTILQIWTYEEEPLKLRLSVHNTEGKPLVGNKGVPLDNYSTEVVTKIPRKGAAAVWEVELYSPKGISGSVKVELGKAVKGGCKLFSRDKSGRRTSLGQDQKGQGPRFTCLFARS